MSVKVYPTVEQLTTVSRDVKCPEKNCAKIFTSESNLTLHLTKTHKQEQLMQAAEDREFYCPQLGCIYNKENFFVSMKKVKQHFRKVHSAKDFLCETCNKGFPTESARRAHSDYCGVLFSCSICDVSYDCYESLWTHGKRKRHIIREKCTFSRNLTKVRPKSSKSLGKPTVARLVLPRPCVVQLVVASNEQIQKVHASTQINIEPKLTTKTVSALQDELSMKKSTQETQTLGVKKPKLTAETQTTGDYGSNKKINLIDTAGSQFNDLLERRSTKTQTNTVPLKSAGCNTSFTFSDLDFMLTDGLEKNTSSTQTYSELISSTSSDVTSTDSVSDSATDLMDFNSSFDSNYFNCNMETQTDIMFDEELLNCDYYSHTETQTCEDMLLRDIGFSTTETQTFLQDMLRSVEIQTLMSHTMKSNVNAKDISHIETQTDTEFKKMLEEINS